MTKTIVILFFLLLATHYAKAQDDFDKARNRYLVQLTGGPDIDLSDPHVTVIIDQITQRAIDDDRKINIDFNANGPFVGMNNFSEANLLAAYGRLKQMAIAYDTKGSRLYNNEALKDHILFGLDWIINNWYTTKQPLPRTPAFPKTGANWFTWDIAAPLDLTACMVLMYPTLSKQQLASYCAVIDYFDPNIAEYTGANLSWVASCILIRGIVDKNSEKVKNGILGIKKALAYSNIPIEGFYRDGSQTAHKSIPYNGGYGSAQFHNVISAEDMLSVTDSLKITGADAVNVYKWAFDSYVPLIYKGSIMPMVMGRYAGRSSSHEEGEGIMRNILFVSQSAPVTNNGFGTNFKGEKYPENPKLAMQQILKYWYGVDVVENHIPDQLFMYTLYKKFIYQNITPATELIGTFRFPVMDRVVHLRPGYGFGISMFSNHIKNYEPLGEFLKGWHTADGMTYIFNNDLTQYDDDFWPTVDSYRLAGTTVALNTTESDNKMSDQDWVGGSDLGQYGTTGMSLHVGTLTALKSWFMFDDEIVALGAGISATDNTEIETIVENRKLSGDGKSVFTVNGKDLPDFKKYKLTNVSWAHLAGYMPGTDIGYHFYKPVELNFIRENRTGSWHDITSHGATGSVSKKFITFWLNHGLKPVDSTYAYAVLPNFTAGQVKAYNINPATVILANTKLVQAVKNNKLNIIAANFWTNSLQSIDADAEHPNYITCDSKASIMTRQTSNKLEVAVSDPTMKNTGFITIEIKAAANSVIDRDNDVTVIQTSPTIKFNVKVNASSGKTYRTTFGL